MEPSGGSSRGARRLDEVAAVLLDGRGRILCWPPAAQHVLAWGADETIGRRARDLLAGFVPVALPPLGGSRVRRVRLRRRSGPPVEADICLVPSGNPGGALVVALPPEERRGRDDGRGLARAPLARNDLGVAHLDMGLRVTSGNRALDALGPGTAGKDWLGDLPRADDGTPLRDVLEEVARTGVPMAGGAYRSDPTATNTDTDTLLLVSAFRVDDTLGTPTGVIVTLTRADDGLPAPPRVIGAHRPSPQIGQSLDVVQVAESLASLLVATLGDLAAVDLPDEVLQGRDPSPGYPGQEASAPRRVAVHCAHGTWPAPLVQVGEAVPLVPEVAQTAAMTVGGILTADAVLSREILGNDPALIEKLMPEGMRCSLSGPLYHRGRFFGYALVYRTDDTRPFDGADAESLHDLCARTALAIDNAFRFTREHQTAVVLQRSLLPPAATESVAAETSGTYLPAGGSLSVGGDWFDALAMSSLRIGLVVGDVVGHGLEAAATMARLRTAVQTLADLDLPPDELLTRLDDLVQRMQAESDEPDIVGGSCLFAVYDPVSQTCQLAAAGHPPPAVVLPDGTVEFVPVVPGPPLGVGNNPFEVYSLHLPTGSLLVLYTDGLLEQDPDAGMTRLARDLAEVHAAGGSLDRLSDALVRRHPHADQPVDDVTLLLARTRAIADHDTAVWQYAADLTAVHDARVHVNTQLEQWGLEDLMFSTELIVSELVTNAIRYAGGPVTLRLIRDRILVCEVSDPSNTQPRLRRALNTDEGGRGLFLVAQLASRWGCRYGLRGKTIWCEQSLTALPW